MKRDWNRLSISHVGSFVCWYRNSVVRRAVFTCHRIISICFSVDPLWKIVLVFSKVSIRWFGLLSFPVWRQFAAIQVLPFDRFLSFVFHLILLSYISGYYWNLFLSSRMGGIWYGISEITSSRRNIAITSEILSFGSVDIGPNDVAGFRESGFSQVGRANSEFWVPIGRSCCCRFEWKKSVEIASPSKFL